MKKEKVDIIINFNEVKVIKNKVGFKGVWKKLDGEYKLGSNDFTDLIVLCNYKDEIIKKLEQGVICG